MNKFNAFIEKRNFKKIFIVYIIFAIVFGAVCCGAVGYAYKSKIKLAARYARAIESFKENGSQKGFDKLASADGVCDVIVLDSENKVIYSAKDFVKDGKFELEQIDGSKFMQNDAMQGAAFRFVKKDEFMLTSVFADGFEEIYDDYDSLCLSKFQSDKLYMISLLGKSGGTRAYVISNPTPVMYGMKILKAAASVFMLLFMIYWIIVALWVYQSALKSKLCAPIWGIITLFTNLAGVLLYVIFRHANNACTFCGAVQPKGNIFCTECGKKIGLTCTECGHILKPGDSFCPKCGHKK